MTEIKPYSEWLREIFEKIKEEYPSLYLTALDYVEGHNIFLNVMHKETNANKAVLSKWLNDNTSLKYEIRRIRNNKINRQ